MPVRMARLIRRVALPALACAVLVPIWFPIEGSTQDASERDSLAVLGSIQDMLGWYMHAERHSTLGPMFDRLWLIAQLDSVAAILPANDWIAGHRVGFRHLVGDRDGALEVALDCRGSSWWCAALTGFAYHNVGLAVRADSAFDVALRDMTEGQRCSWSDLSLLLDSQSGSSYGKADCARRMEMERRIWWLADPLHLMPGNDRRAEHFARRVGLTLSEQLHEVEWLHPAHCGECNEAILRMGWPARLWGYIIPTPAAPWGVGFGFFPTGIAILDPLSAEISDFHLESRATPRLARERPWTDERYLPRYGVFRQLDQQVAAFLRGDSLLLIVAAATGDSLLIDNGPLRTGIVLARHEDDTPIVQIDTLHRDRYVFRVTLARERYLLSIEAFGREAFGRARLGVGPPPAATGGMGISDLLLFEIEGDEVPQGFELAVERMLGTTRLSSDRKAGVYWELYDSSGSQVTVAVSAVPDRRPGILRRLAASVGILRASEAPAKVIWREPTASPGVRARSLGIDLSLIPPGHYTLELVATNGDGDTAVARRRIEIVSGPARGPDPGS